jgi:hypothetical protein
VTREEFHELLNSERDPFRLAIRGHAAIDAKIDEILEDAFVERMPDFLRGPSFHRKMEMVVALGLVPPSFRDPIARLTKLRNDFSHGKLVELDERRAKDLLDGLAALLPKIEIEALPAGDPRGALMLTIGIVWFGLVTCEKEARKHREDVKTALVRAKFGGSELAYMLGEAARREREQAAAGEKAEPTEWPDREGGSTPT